MESLSIKSRDERLPDIVLQIRRGEWKIPRFQRDFVWEKKRVIALLDSIYKGFPIGTFFLWIPPEDYATYYKDIPEMQISPVNSKFNTHFIIDGQQRLTSLYVVVRALKLNGVDYSAICFDLDKEEFNLGGGDQNRNIPVHLILNNDFTIYDNLTAGRKTTFKKLNERFTNYPFPVVTIGDKTLEQACTIFERINQAGQKLKLFDLVVALTWDPNFELKKEIHNFNKEIENSFGAIEEEVFTELLSLIVHKQCTRAFQMRLTAEKVKGVWPDAIKALKRTIQFLRSDLNVVSYSLLPYRDMLPLIAYYFYHKPGIDANKELLADWIWKASFANRYSGTTLTKMGEDREDIFDRAIRGEDVTINYAVDYAANIAPEKIAAIPFGKQSALKNALLLLLVQEQPKSFYDNSAIDVTKTFISKANMAENHHIFPKAFLRSHGIKEADLLINFCFIDSALNKYIGNKPPSEYFSAFREKNPTLDVALASHAIPLGKESGIWTNDYHKFKEQRAKLIHRLAMQKLGDLGASVDDQMENSPAKVVENVEKRIRRLIHSVLYTAYGEQWWDAEGVVPKDVKVDAQKKILQERASKPYVPESEWMTPQRLLEQVNVMDYQKVILTNWPHFEDIFVSKENFQQYFKKFFDLRNQIAHTKTLDQLEKEFGTTSVKWLLKCMMGSEEREDDEVGEIPHVDTRELYEVLAKGILGLGNDIKRSDKKHYTGFSTKPPLYFITMNRRVSHIKVWIFVKKETFQDTCSLAKEDKSANENRAGSWREFIIKTKGDIEYAISLIKQAYEYNQSRVVEFGGTEAGHLEGKPKEIVSLYQSIKQSLQKIDNGIIANPQKYYIAFKTVGINIFAYLHMRKSKINIDIMLPFEDAKKLSSTSKIKPNSEEDQKRFGNKTLLSIDGEGDLKDAVTLLDAAYRRQQTNTSKLPATT